MSFNTTYCSLNQQLYGFLDQGKNLLDVASKFYHETGVPIGRNIASKLGYKTEKGFIENYKIAPLALALFATFSFLPIPALIVSGTTLTAAVVCSEVKIINEAAIKPFLRAAFVAAVLVTAVKIIALIAVGAGLLPIAGTFILGGLVAATLYLLLNRELRMQPVKICETGTNNSPQPHPFFQTPAMH